MADSHISGPIPQCTYEKEDPLSVEIEAILKFHRDTEPKTLQEIGFELLGASSFSHFRPEFTQTPPSTEVEQQENFLRNRWGVDDSWMPEGWRKEERPRPMDKGKFPGYIDKKYYAPGVRRAFRSKSEALKYIEELRNHADTRSE